MSEPGFIAWNTIIGEGSAEEYANDLLVLVEVVGSGGRGVFEDILEIRTRRGEGLTVGMPAGNPAARRRLEFAADLGRGPRLEGAVSARRRLRRADPDVVATIGRSTRRETVNLVCGE